MPQSSQLPPRDNTAVFENNLNSYQKQGKKEEIKKGEEGSHGGQSTLTKDKKGMSKYTEADENLEKEGGLV
ncbi:hypothetical protein BDW69DRAFT_189135 [Aspergillus filifer]